MLTLRFFVSLVEQNQTTGPCGSRVLFGMYSTGDLGFCILYLRFCTQWMTIS